MADTLALQRPSAGDILESVLLKGDLSKLSQDERITYMYRVCESAGLNPLTRPLEYISLSGKLVLYAKKDATDQLRKIHAISVSEMTESERDGVMTVTVKVSNADGRTDMDKGSVNIANLKGDALANAIMKAATKAKRRATLSICGLGLLDETEIETIPNAVALPDSAEPAGGITPHSLPRQQVRDSYTNVAGIMASDHNVIVNENTGKEVRPNNSNNLRKHGAWDSFEDKVQGFRDNRDADGLRMWFTGDDVQARIAKWPQDFREAADELFNATFDWIVEQK